MYNGHPTKSQALSSSPAHLISYGVIMGNLTREQVEAALKQYREPYFGVDLVTARAVKSVEVQADQVSVHIDLGYPAAGYRDQLAKALISLISKIDTAARVQVQVSSTITTHSVQKGIKPLAGVKNTIAVASGKGGVGKSTTAVNLALAMAAEGAKVGILDADIYGPSQPRMLGSNARPESKDGRSMEPIVSHGLQSMSIGYLIDDESPMIWRGPMVTQALEQLLRDTNWHDLDYLVIDLPPGTGDTQLTLAQKIPVTGVVIITTPQDIALLDARKGLKMFQKVEVPVLGIIENMSTHICSKCGHEEHIFGEGGGQRMAQQYGVDLLGQLPLELSIRELTDSGRPSVVADPNGRIALAYRDIARRVGAKIALLAKDYSGRFPNIVIQNT